MSKTITLFAIAAIVALTVSCKDNVSMSVETGHHKKTASVEILPYGTDPDIDSGTKKFLEVLNSGGTPLEQLSKEEARAVLVNAQAGVKVDVSGIDESEKTITSDGLTVKLNIVRPHGKTGKLPVFVFVHGGGWILGDYPTHRRFVRDLVVESGFVAVFVNYTPSPEAKYPVAINEIYAATKWVSEHGNEVNVDGTKLAIVGNSAGGNMAAAVTLLAKEKNGPEIQTQILFWPVADAGFATESYQKFGTDRFLTASVMKWMFDQYTTDPAERNSRYITLVNATTEQLQGLPPTLIQVAQNDILRDEGETYGRKLDAAGVAVTTIRYNGMIHDFGLLNALAELPATRSLFVHAAAHLQKQLN